MKVLKDLGTERKNTNSNLTRYYLVECPECLGAYKVAASTIKLGRSTQCSNCKKGSVRFKREFISRANIVHENRYTYELPVKTSTRTHITIICKVHGQFLQTAGAHLQGQGCPSCAEVKRYTEEEYDKLVQAKHGTDIKRIGTYHNNRTLTSHICKCGNIWDVIPNSILSGNACPKCNRGTTGDTLYIWNIGNTDIYKIGITSRHLGMDRIISVKKALEKEGFTIRPILEIYYTDEKAREIEKSILKMYVNCPINIPRSINGKSEFRLLTRGELNKIKEGIYGNT